MSSIPTLSSGPLNTELIIGSDGRPLIALQLQEGIHVLHCPNAFCTDHLRRP